MMYSTHLDYFNFQHDQILKALGQAYRATTNHTKRLNMLNAVDYLKRVRRMLQRESLAREYAAALEDIREQIEAAARRANLPSDLEGRISKPQAPKRPYGVKRIRATNHAFWRACNPEKVPSDLE